MDSSVQPRAWRHTVCLLNVAWQICSLKSPAENWGRAFQCVVSCRNAEWFQAFFFAVLAYSIWESKLQWQRDEFTAGGECSHRRECTGLYHETQADDLLICTYAAHGVTLSQNRNTSSPTEEELPKASSVFIVKVPTLTHLRNPLEAFLSDPKRNFANYLSAKLTLADWKTPQLSANQELRKNNSINWSNDKDDTLSISTEFTLCAYCEWLWPCCLLRLFLEWRLSWGFSKQNQMIYC